MKYPDFGKCQIRSLYVARQLVDNGVRCNVLFGTYTPKTPPDSWDERWQKVAIIHAISSEFSHSWVEVGGLFLDCSLLQFGETSFIWTDQSDIRYHPLGYINLKTGERVHTGNEILVWDSYNEKDGVPTLQLVQVFV